MKRAVAFYQYSLRYLWPIPSRFAILPSVEIIPGVHDVDLGLVHAFLYKEADRLTLIDTGIATNGPEILKVLTDIGSKPAHLQQIIVTHYHADHMGSLAELVEKSGAQVAAHELDAPVVRGAPEDISMLSEAERRLHDTLIAQVPPAPPSRVDRELNDGDEIDVAGGAQVVHVPGHTPGSIAIYLPERKALFLGDAAARMPEGQVIAGVYNLDEAQTRRSFLRLAELEFEAAFFGHGAPMDKDASLTFRRTAEKLGR
jgi:glyoxylase-like metal-dependent hydrolase (beta-lactamase superfamily II)